jgi:hypothetical protein
MLEKLRNIESLLSLALAVIPAGGAVIYFWKYIQWIADLEGSWVYPVAILLIFGASVAVVAVAFWVLRLLGSTSWQLRRERIATQNPSVSQAGLTELVTKLDREFFAEGVGHRNRVQNARPIIDQNEYLRERDILVGWSKRAQSLLDNSEHVTVKEQSNFRTLYNLTDDPRVPKLGPYQTQLVKMWNRKLDMLRSIIDRIGG